MKILIVENILPNKQPWWLKFLPETFDKHNLEMVKIPESTGSIISILLQLLRLYPRLNKFDIVLTHQDSYSTFLFSSLARALPFKKYRQVVHEFITREKGSDLYSKLKYAFLSFSLKGVDCINCSSRLEIEYYREVLDLPNVRFEYIPLTTNPKFLELSSSITGKYIFSAGRTGRDYKTLVEAVRGLPVELYLVASQNNVDGLDLPENVKLFIDIPLDELIDKMSHARFVVIPLQDRRISVGQSVILQAMALGKGLITTRTDAVWDYVKQDETGLLVDPYNVPQMRAAITRLSDDPDLCVRLGTKARKITATKFVPKVSMLQICRVMRQLTGD